MSVGYRVWNQEERKIIAPRDVSFLETFKDYALKEVER